MISVLKANGKTEPFDQQKILFSIRRAGIPPQLEKKIIEHIKSELREGIKTSEIYHHIREFLGKSEAPYTKAKYSLKQAIMALGPTGYPFEDFISQLLVSEGYKTQVRVMTQGKCITHEIDVIAEKEMEKKMVEAKFHNTSGIKTDVHVSLYTKARFDDVKESGEFTKVMLATNTKITDEALAFAMCEGMEVLSWSYPENKSLRDLIEKSSLIPVTALTGLSQGDKFKLINQGIIFTKNLCSDLSCLTRLGLSEELYNQVSKEAQYLSV